jgi:hypothetical protein
VMRHRIMSACGTSSFFQAAQKNGHEFKTTHDMHRQIDVVSVAIRAVSEPVWVVDDRDASRPRISPWAPHGWSRDGSGRGIYNARSRCG